MKKGKKDADSDISLDFSSLKKSFSSFPNVGNKVNFEYVVAALFVIFCLVLVFSIRMLPASLPLTDSWADATLQQNIRAQVATQVDQQFPALPDTNRNALIERRTNELIAQEQAQFDTVIATLSEQFKSHLRYTGEDGEQHTYLGDIDSYFWARYARNVLETGTACDAVVEGECKDMYQNAPQGAPMPRNPSLHVFGIAWLHKFMTLFNSGYPLLATSFLLQALLGALVTVPAFFLGRRLGGNVAGLFAAILIALHPLFLSRGLGSDNDPWILFMALMMFWMTVEAVDAKALRNRIIFAALAGLATAGLAASWDGWWFIYLVIFLGLLAALVFRVLTTVLETKQYTVWQAAKVRSAAVIIGVFYISAFIFLLIAGEGDASYFSIPLLSFSSGATLDQAVAGNYWPNVLTTVAELNKSSFGEAVNSMGGKFFFFAALIGLLLLFMPRAKTWDWKQFTLLGLGVLISLYLINNPAAGKLTVLFLIALPIALVLATYLFKEEHIDIAAGLIVLVWFMASIYAVYSGVRFILLMIPAFGVAFGIVAGRIYEWTTRYFGKQSSISKYFINIGIFILIALLLIQPIKAGYSVAHNYAPSVDDAWWDSLTKIKQETAPDAIINSWWDFGHWFKYIADRRVSADGTTQHTHVPRWLGLLLVTPNEKESIGILRMLDCGSDAYPYEGGERGAYGKILSKTGDPILAERMVRELAVMNEQEARAHLAQNGFTATEQESVLASTHCEPPENYLITSGDMVGKAGVWAHFGLWDFERAYIVENRQRPEDEVVPELVARFGYTEEQAQQLYYEARALTTEGAINAWIAPWPGYITGWVQCSVTNTTWQCPVGIAVNQQGATITAIDGVIVNESDPASSVFVLSAYQNNQIVGQVANASPSSTFIAGSSFETVAAENPATGLGLLIDVENKRVMIGDPLLLGSTFTKLFYLDGRYSEHFVKFDDRTGVTGTRIIVWKVDWDGPQQASTSSTAFIR